MPLPLLQQTEQLPFPQPTQITAATTGNKNNAVAPATLTRHGNGRLSFKPVAIGPHKPKHIPLRAQLLSYLSTSTSLPTRFPHSVAALRQYQSGIFLLERRKKEQTGLLTHVTESNSQDFSGTLSNYTSWAPCFQVIPCCCEISLCQAFQVCKDITFTTVQLIIP